MISHTWTEKGHVNMDVTDVYDVSKITECVAVHFWPQRKGYAILFCVEVLLCWCGVFMPVPILDEHATEGQHIVIVRPNMNTFHSVSHQSDPQPQPSILPAWTSGCFEGQMTLRWNGGG